MNRMLIALVAMSITCACATTGTSYPKARTLCASAETWRALYRTSIAAADAYVASGRLAPTALALGREAAVLALAVLDANCPAQQPRRPINGSLGGKDDTESLEDVG